VCHDTTLAPENKPGGATYAGGQIELKSALSMKSLFAGYYRPAPKEFDELWKNCIFVFDASVLLDLYRSTAKTRDVVLSILGKIKDRIWIPYQAAWEYQENRLEVIGKERALYSELRETLDGLVNSVQQKLHNHGVESAEKIKTELEAAAKKIIAIIDQGASQHPDLMASDHIREGITELFNAKVGKQLDEKRLISIYQEGAKRYEAKIPPGYEDVKKGGNRQFGDLIIWMEILEHAKSIKRPVIFVTSDTKEDWWWKHGQFTVGPRPELVQEMASIANEKFYMYNVERFLSEAQKRVDTRVGSTEVEKAAEEFKDIETKKQIAVEIPSDVVADLQYISEQSDLLTRGVASRDFQEMFTRYLTEAMLERKFASDRIKLSAEEWADAIQNTRDRKLSENEIARLRDAITRGDIARLIRPSKDLKDASQAVSMYLALLEGLHSK
jgi:hypothetical protein